jgi:taurine dioxygenase
MRAVNSSASAAPVRTHVDGTADSSHRDYEAEHPVVRVHPETGRRSLFVNIAHTTRFAGMTEAESRPLLDELFAHQVRPEFVWRLRWEAGMVTVWDNRCTLHNPINDYDGHLRLMHRITLEGDTPV